MKYIKSLAFVIALLLMTSCGNNEKLKSIGASGTIESTNVIVSAKSSGEILEVIFSEGQKLNVGDTVIRIDNENLRLQLRQAAASKDVAEAQYSLMVKGARDEDISQAEQNLNQAKVNFESAERDKNRMQNLFEARSVTQKQLEDAITRFEMSKAQLISAQENFNKLKKIFRPEELAQAKANLDKAVSAMELLQKNINDTYITSPINGFIVKSFVERGESVAPMSSLFKVSDLDIVELVIYVTTEELAYVKLGQEAEVSIDAFEEKIYPGRVIYISPEAEFTPKNIQTKDERTKLVFAVKISIDNPEYELKPGMPADALIKL